MMDEMQQELIDTKTELSDTKNKLSEISEKLSDSKETIIKTIITMTKEYSGTKEQAIAKLMSNCSKSKAEADVLIEKYW